MKTHRKFQREYFNNSKNRYEQDKIFTPPIHSLLEVEQIIKRIPKKTKEVVDFGAGNGRLTTQLLKTGYFVIAVDISERSLSQLKKNAGKIGRKKLLTTRNLSLLEKQNTVVGCDVLHHVDVDKELRNIYNVLIQGGRVVFSEPNGLNIVWYAYILLKRIWKVEKRILFINYFNLGKVLKDLGFRNIQIEGLGLLPAPLFRNKKLCRWNYSLGNLPLLKIFSYRLIISAEK